MSSRESTTLVSLARRWAEERGQETAAVYLEDGAEPIESITFEELDSTSRRIASALLERAEPGDRALLVYETGLDFVRAFMACAYARLVSIPIPAPQSGRLDRSLPRMGAVAVDSSARLLLADRATLDILEHHEDNVSSISPEDWIDTEGLREHPGPVQELEPATPDDILYMQYTSGSTSTPKGVMVTHGNLIENLGAIRAVEGYDEDSVTVTWMPHFHDYGLIEGHLLPIFNGTPVYLMSPYAFVKRPIRWLEALSRYRGTHTQAPNFAYGLSVRRISREKASPLDLSSVVCCANAAEPINPRTQQAFCDHFGPVGFRLEAMSPAYGLAEATLIVSSTPPTEAPTTGYFDGPSLHEGRVVLSTEDDPDHRTVASCGRPLPGVTVAIVDPDTLERCPPDRVGEIWVSGPSVAQGYWHRPEESRETFDARIAGEDGPPHLRTGDLGFMADGLIYVTSRLKDLIIINGLNHHPQEIEWAVQATHDSLRPGNGAAFSVFDEESERLVVVQEVVDGHSDEELDALAAGIVAAVAGRFDLAVHGIALIEKGTLQKTTSGKIRRRAMRDAYLNGGLQTVRAWTADELLGMRRPAAGPTVVAPGPLTPTPLAPVSAPSARTEGPGPEAPQRTEALVSWIREYAEERINSRLIDERRCLPPNVVLDFGNRGVFGLLAPQRYGGLELGYRGFFRVLEQIAAADLTLATFVHLHNTNGTLPVLDFARPAVRDELMPLLATGREFGAFGLSEPGAGTHLAAVGMTATRDGDGWVLNGTKRWNASAWSRIVSVFARTKRDDGSSGPFTAFVLRHDDPGVRIGPESLTMGMRGIMQNSLEFEDVHVSPSQMLGEEGKGMAIAQHVLARGRLSAAALALGGGRRCAQLILRYASRREIETGLLLDNPQTLVRLSELTHRLTAHQEVVHYCGDELDRGGLLIPEVAMVLKILATDTLNYGADLLVQILGGRGYMENNLASQIFRDARMWSIGEGANEGLLGVVGRSARLAPTLHDFLREFGGDDALAARVAQDVRHIDEEATAPGASTEQGIRIWKDVMIGAITCAALDRVAIGRRNGRGRSDESALRWAETRYDQVLGAALDGTPGGHGSLPAPELRDRIAAYEARIGDLEPRAPEPDVALDPLIRRDDPDADQRARLQKKREALRSLLEREAAPGSRGK